MKYLLLTISLFLLIIGCNSKEKDIDKMKKDLVQYINDDSFKNNEKVVIYKFDILKIDTIKKSLCDSNLYYFINQSESDRYLQLSNLLVLRDKEQLIKLQIQKITNSISKSDIDEVKDDDKLLKSYSDTIRMINNYIDSMRKEISKKPNNDNVYKLKTLMKLTIFKNNDSTNYLDTSYFYFDKKLNRIKFDDYKFIKN